jgi:hypothetical protein
MTAVAAVFHARAAKKPKDSACAGVETAQGLGLDGQARSGQTESLLLGRGEHVGEDAQEIVQPRCEVGVGPSLVVVVVRMESQRAVVSDEVLGVVLLQGEESVQVVSAAMERERREQAPRPAVAVGDRSLRLG